MKSLRLIALLLGCFTVSLQAQSEPINSFWSHRFNATLNIAYGQLPSQKLDIYRQGTWTGPPDYFVPHKKLTPTLVYIHGGAWHGGTKESALPFFIHYLEKGYQVVNVEYRRGGNTAPAAAEDVLLMMQWLSKNANEYAIDLSNIVVSGDSAGGHLALLAGLDSQENKSLLFPLANTIHIKAIVNLFGISDLVALDQYFEQNKGWNYPRKWAGNKKNLYSLASKYSPINRISQHSPAIISIHGSSDHVVPLQQSKALHKKLTDLNITNKLVVLPGGRHLGFTDQQFQQIYSEIFNFLETKVTFH